MAGHEAFCEDDIISGRRLPSRSYRKKKVGGYMLGHVIGSGSFAKVCIATHILTEERVAIKVIDKKVVEKREYVRRNLRREAAMLQRLNHPNIVQLYEVLETPNNYYLVLELADGDEFMSYLCDKRKLTERETRRFMRQMLSAVDHMHQADIIHRDIKIENLLLDKDYNLKIIDFGLSNMLGMDGLLQTQCGSPAYAAPEIFCNVAYGPAVDVWSMGVNMYAMVTGELPFKVDPPTNMFKLQKKILQGCFIPTTLSKDCKDLLGRMLEPNESLRIKVREIMKHPWMNRGYSCKLFPSKFPNKPRDGQLDRAILDKMVDHGFDPAAVVASVVENKPVASRATYQLMMKRLLSGYGYPDAEAANVSEEDTVSSTVSNTSTLRSTMDCSKWSVVRKGYLKNVSKKRNYYDRTKGLRDVAFARKVARAQSEKQPRRYVQTPTKEEVIEDMTKNMGLSQKTELDDVAVMSNLLPRQHDPEGMYYIQVDLPGGKTSENKCHADDKAKGSPESAKVTRSLRTEHGEQGCANRDGASTTFMTSYADGETQAGGEELETECYGRISLSDDNYPDDLWKEIDIAINRTGDDSPSPVTPIEAVRRSNTFLAAHDAGARTKGDASMKNRNGCIFIVNGQIKDERFYEKGNDIRDKQKPRPVAQNLASQYNRFARTTNVGGPALKANRMSDTYVQRLGMYYGVPRPARSMAAKAATQSARPTYYQPIRTQRSVLVNKPKVLPTSKSYAKTGGGNVTARGGGQQYTLPVIATAAPISKPAHQ